MGNKCSGGIFKKKKKCVVIQTRELAEWEHHAVPCSNILPTELWEVVFIYLKEDTKDLLHCRVVCKDFKKLADDMLECEQNWTPLFPYISTLPLVFIGGYGETVIRRSKGTRFSSGSSIRHFLEAMKGHKGNPFPHRSVLVFPNPDLCLPSRKPHHMLYKKFSKLVKYFGQQMYALEYCVRDDVAESIEGLRNIFEMDNLRSLTVYTRDWNKKKVRNGLFDLSHDLYTKILPGHQGQLTNFHKEEEGTMDDDDQNQIDVLYSNSNSKNGCLDCLESLQILGSNGILPLNYLFSPFGEQIKSLYFCFMDDASSLQRTGYAGEPRRPLDIDPQALQGLTYSIAELTPNITKLKVYEVNEDLLSKIMPRVGPNNEGKIKHLEHLSIKLQRPFIRPLNRLCKAIDEHCADTLVNLHLEISRWPPQDSSANGEEREPNISIDPRVKLEKLEDIVISYSLFLQEPEFLYKFCQKCPNLKSLCFISVNIHSGSFPDLEGFCDPLWRKLPESLEKISVKYWISREILTENLWALRTSGGNIPNPQVYYHFCYAPQRLSFFRRQPKYHQAEPVPRLQTAFRPRVVNSNPRRWRGQNRN